MNDELEILKIDNDYIYELRDGKLNGIIIELVEKHNKLIELLKGKGNDD